MEETYKICSTCKIEKNINEFHSYINSKDGHTHRCKKCVSRKNNVPSDVKKCKSCNFVKQLEEFTKRKNGKFGRNSICKKCQNNKLIEYRKNNIVRIRSVKNKWRNEKRKNDPIFKLICNMRSRMYDFLLGRKIRKNNLTFEIIGCSPIELKKHLENQFPDGMNWENYGKWHIDHIRPCSSFDFSIPEEQFKCFNYKNLQPLWAKDNFAKSDKIEGSDDLLNFSV